MINQFNYKLDSPEYALAALFKELEDIRANLDLAQYQFSQLLGGNVNTYNAILNFRAKPSLAFLISVRNRYPHLRGMVENYINRLPTPESRLLKQ